MKQPLKCVLLVDDDEATNYLNNRLLKKNGYAEQVHIAENGQEGIDFLQSVEERDKPELIFLDINMPIMNGWEFLEAYEQLEHSKKVKAIIVMLTTSIQAEDRFNAELNNDVSDFIPKPLTPASIREIIRQHFPDRL